MKEEMAAIRSVSDSREDFIAIMQDYGYEIARQEINSITWWNKTHTRKIRDKTLGNAYELGVMFSEHTITQEPMVSREPKKEKHRPKTISIARYDWNGRRRSDLEILIRKAIALIQHVGNRYQVKKLSSTHSTSRKLEMMEQALDMVSKMGLENREDLEKQMDEVGAKLNHIKAELRKLEGQKVFYDVVSPMLSSFQSTKATVNSIQYWPDGTMPDLMITPPSPADMQKAKAALCPMSNTQKRDLYLLLQAYPEYVLSGDGFAGVSAMDAEEIFAFFKGTKSNMPECLKKNVDVTMERIYQKRYDFLQKTYDKPILKYQQKEIESLLSAHGITLDTSTLTQADAINIRNCYGNNPFSEQPINATLQTQLYNRLSEHGFSLNRDIQYILPSEYEKIMNYLDGFARTVPGILKFSPNIDSREIDTLQKFMDAKGITSSIPISAMCKADYDKMYGYVISQGQTPVCAIPQTVDRTEEFINSIQIDGITEKKQLLLLQLRNQTNELLNLGIDPVHIEELSSAISEFRETYDSLETSRIQLAAEYKSLLQLNQQLTYAESPSFIFGSLFDEKVHEKPEVIEKEEKDTKSSDMPNKLYKKFNLDTDMDL